MGALSTPIPYRMLSCQRVCRRCQISENTVSGNKFVGCRQPPSSIIFATSEQVSESSAHFIRLELVDAVPLVQYLPEASLIAPKANLILVVPLTPLLTLGHNAAIGVDLPVETAHKPCVEGLLRFDDAPCIVPNFKCHARAQQSACFVVIT